MGRAAGTNGSGGSMAIAAALDRISQLDPR